MSIGDALPKDLDRNVVATPAGLTAAWPLNANGQEGNWRCSPSYLRELVEQGYAKVGSYDAKNDRHSLLYLGKAQIKSDLPRGRSRSSATTLTARVILEGETDHTRRVTAKTVWNRLSHRAGGMWSTLVKR